MNALRALIGERSFLAIRRHYRLLRDALRLLRASCYDTYTYARGSGLLRSHQPETLKTHILKSFHRIEKGLALPAPKPGFGVDAVRQLLDDLAHYLPPGSSDWVLRAAMQSLDEYVAFNQRHDVNVDWVEQGLARLRARAGAAVPASADSSGGTLQLSRASLHEAGKLPFERFVRSRHSVRQFAERAVDAALIEQAVEMARFSPSVCNRSAGHVYLVEGADKARELLALQNGNRGFGDTAGRILVITSRAEAFHTVGERYQGWIDGGLFAMSLIYALHSLGLGSCCLNWSVEPATDRALKRAAGIRPGDQVIMLLAVGHLPEMLTVARSARRPVEEVLTRI